MEGILMEFLSFMLGDEQYAIDILCVREIRAYMPVTRIANAAASMKGIFDLRGAIVPVFDMRILLGLAPAPAGGHPVVIILDIDGKPAGIVVDSVCQVVALVEGSVKPVPAAKAHAAASSIRGVASLEEGMLIVLDIARLMASLDEPVRAEAA
ncbi:MAG: chemotaxis protein CheW [Burkholderiales bacterium]|nr:chemotaxis protein CheW [Burkholderiales bacterium]